ncbi:hypothetical protein EG329_011380 [Mollisiaceae sp. DMI_Dod_QoI]|nr:hypothetical protein EG329_011380 [Helotiales sp. DMI_Dod_QoI]
MSTGNKAKTYRIRQLPCILTYPRQVASFLAGIVPDLGAEDVKVFSLATSLNLLEIPPTKVATVMFDRVPPAFNTNDDQWIIPGQSAGLVRDVIVDIHFRDFTPLNDVPQNGHVLDLGGIVLKQSMVTMARTGDSSNDMIGLIRGVVFFGVPNRGMKVSHLFPMVEDQPNSHIVQLLSTDSDYLQSLDQQFSGIVTHRGIRILSIYETKRSATTVKTASGQWRRDGPLDLLVDKSSAIQQSSNDHLPIDEDHSNLVKFGADDQDCQAIVDFIYDTAAAISSNSAKPSEASSVFDQSRPGSDEDEIDVMISSINFEETGHRLNEIQAQYKSTFEWIFDDEELGFLSWLGSPREVYWISGKPGSGKSTLMKLARQDTRTNVFFNKHDPEASHLIIDFFFHDRGSANQKSLEGLLYRILYQLMIRERKLAKLVLPIVASQLKVASQLDVPSRLEPRRITWTLHDLRQALDIVFTQTQVPLRILLFLDALDEFDGEPQTIADFVKDLVRPRPGSATELKICCSSRPWNVFRDAFSDLVGCKVHEHTKEDIRRYIDGRFKSNTRMSGMMVREGHSVNDTIQTLKHGLSTRAEGVFVWVRLVLDELLKACTDGSMPEELIQTLSSIPDDLDKSYQRLIDRIPLDYKFESYIMIEIVLRSEDPFGLRDLGLAFLCALSSSPADAAKRLPSDPYSEEFLIATRRRLQSRCGGILEVLEDTTVQFMHQTAKEFFSRPGSVEAILQHDARLSQENGYSFLTKFWLTLASAPSQSFDWLSYILSMFRGFSYVIKPHYLMANPIMASHLNTSLRFKDPDTMVELDHRAILYAGFTSDLSQRRCLNYAYLSETSTGRSQRDFLDQLQDEMMPRFFYDAVPIDRRDVQLQRHLFTFSVATFAKWAGLRLYIDEARRASAEPPAARDKRRRQRQQNQPRQQYHPQPGPSSANPRPERRKPQSQSSWDSSARREPEWRSSQHYPTEDEPSEDEVSDDEPSERHCPEQSEPQNRSSWDSHIPRDPKWRGPERRSSEHYSSEDELYERYSPEQAERQNRSYRQSYWQPPQSPEWHDTRYQPRPEPRHPFQGAGRPDWERPPYQSQAPLYHSPPPGYATPGSPMPQYYPRSPPYQQYQQRPAWEMPPNLSQEEMYGYPSPEWLNAECYPYSEMSSRLHNFVNASAILNIQS